MGDVSKRNSYDIIVGITQVLGNTAPGNCIKIFTVIQIPNCKKLECLSLLVSSNLV